jgi:thiol-disulfide isomerase/thioredoxin
MRIDKGRVRVPEIGRVWLNSPPLNMRQLRGRAVLIDFWDYTCVNCIRTLPYIQAWHEKYKDLGLTVIGVHTPEFTFAQYESNVERGVREFGLTYPILIDSDFELFKLFANRAWPSKYLIDKDGYLRYMHMGEGGYAEAESVIQELLREIQAKIELPPLMSAIRGEDEPGAVCYAATPELYLGHRRGRIGNESGFAEDRTTEYKFTGDPQENVFYAEGRWHSSAEYFEAAGNGDDRIIMKYSAASVNLVLSSNRAPSGEISIKQDGQPLAAANSTNETKFRDGVSYLPVESPRMYALVDNHDFGTHMLELTFGPGVAAYAFTFTSCVDPSAIESSSAENKDIA